MMKQKLKTCPPTDVVICLAGLILAGMMGTTSCSQTQKAEAQPDAGQAPTVAVAEVKRQDLARKFTIAAEFRPFQEIKIYAKEAGYVKRINVDIGDRVKTGQLLATIEIPELTADLERAKASVRRSQDELNRSQDDLQRAQSAHQVAHLEYNRLAAVAKERPELVAQQELDDAEGRDREAEAQASSAEAGLAAAREQLQVDQASLQKEQSMWDYSRITAPFSGVITQRFADTGAMVAAGTSSEKNALPVVQLDQTDLLRLDIPVPESNVPKIRLNSPVQVSVQALGKTFGGVVARFADNVDTETRTMITEVDVRNSGLVLVPGMYAEATITLDEKQGALVIPVQAVSRQGNQANVLMIDPASKIAERSVTLGLETSDKVEVTSGLNPGDLVVIGGRGQVQEGMPVKPKLEGSSGAGGKA